MAEPINLHVHVDVLGPVTIIGGNSPEQEQQMSDLTDAVQALVAEDSLVVQTLDDLKAKADSGSVGAAEVSAAVDTLKAEHDKLVAAVAADTTTIPGSSTTGTGPVSAPGSAPGDPTVPPAGTVVQPDPAPVEQPAPDAPAAPLDDTDPGPAEAAAAS